MEYGPQVHRRFAQPWYDDDVSGSALNQVTYNYDEWGNATAIGV